MLKYDVQIIPNIAILTVSKLIKKVGMQKITLRFLTNHLFPIIQGRDTFEIYFFDKNAKLKPDTQSAKKSYLLLSFLRCLEIETNRKKLKQTQFKCRVKDLPGRKENLEMKISTTQESFKLFKNKDS